MARRLRDAAQSRFLLSAAAVLVVLIAAFLLGSSYRGHHEHATAMAPGMKMTGDQMSPSGTATFTPKGAAVQYAPDAEHHVVLKDLGLTLTVPADLARQGLIGVPGADPAERSKSIAFATDEIASRANACKDDGTRGWLGTLTRYEGKASAMPDMAHMVAMFDYPGFHTTYRSVTQSCAARAPGSTAADLAAERQAAGELWQAIRTARPTAAAQAG
jgi:hypothetical protein